MMILNSITLTIMLGTIVATLASSHVEYSQLTRLFAILNEMDSESETELIARIEREASSTPDDELFEIELRSLGLNESEITQTITLPLNNISGLATARNGEDRDGTISDGSISDISRLSDEEIDGMLSEDSSAVDRMSDEAIDATISDNDPRIIAELDALTNETEQPVGYLRRAQDAARLYSSYLYTEGCRLWQSWAAQRTTIAPTLAETSTTAPRLRQRRGVAVTAGRREAPVADLISLASAQVEQIRGDVTHYHDLLSQAEAHRAEARRLASASSKRMQTASNKPILRELYSERQYRQLAERQMLAIHRKLGNLVEIFRALKTRDAIAARNIALQIQLIRILMTTTTTV